MGCACRLYKYGGEIKDNLILINTADIKFCDLYDSLNLDLIDEGLRNKLKSIYNKVEKEELRDKVTLSDDRLVLLFNNLMVKHAGVFNGYGLEQWFIVFWCLVQFYDSGIPDIDSLIKYINLYICHNFSSVISSEQLDELETLSAKLKDNYARGLVDYSKVIPYFVLSHILEGFEKPKIEEPEIPQPKVEEEPEGEPLTVEDIQMRDNLHHSLTALELLLSEAESEEEKELINNEINNLSIALDDIKLKIETVV